MKNALIEAGISHFGKSGFEGAATRAIAADAGTNMSSITYYFGSKEGLYTACAELIAEELKRHMTPASAELEPSDMDAEQAVENVIVVLLRFAKLMLSEESSSWSGFILREQQSPTKAFDIIFDGVMAPVISKVIRFIRIARPELSAKESKAIAISLWGQAVVLRVARSSILRLFEEPNLSDDTIESLLAQIQDNARAVLQP